MGFVEVEQAAAMVAEQAVGSVVAKEVVRVVVRVAAMEAETGWEAEAKVVEPEAGLVAAKEEVRAVEKVEDSSGVGLVAGSAVGLVAVAMVAG